MLVVENVTKKFAGVVALEKVNLEIYGGQVTAIIGENGAGKSTLMKILSGVYSDYEGNIIYKGSKVSFSNPKQAQEAGITIIHQELNLIPYLSIAENIFLGREIMTSWNILNQKEMYLHTLRLLKKLKLEAYPDMLISDLKVGQQQIVEIAKALLLDSEVIIMDEPTSAISESEVEILFGIIEDLRRENKAIVYISHKLDELFRIADRFVVLRDGRTIESGEMKGITQDDIIQKMVGREIILKKGRLSEAVVNSSTDSSFSSEHVSHKSSAKIQKEEILSIENLSLKHPEKADQYLLKNISFTLNKGEIIGLFGLMGAGRTELLEAIFGLHSRNLSGRIKVCQQEIAFKSPSDAIKSGIALVPEDRKKDGLLLGQDVKTNISLTTLQDMEEMGLLNDSKESRLAEKYIHELRIKTSSQYQQAKNLSGGNQQKIVIAKWLATHPLILLLDEPTRGIDINAKNDIYKLILGLAEAGLGIIMVSSELPEILAVSDRVIVMSEGNLTAEISGSEASEDTILKAAIPKNGRCEI